MTFVTEDLLTFPIKTIKVFNFKNLLSVNNTTRPWPVENSSVAHKLRNPGLNCLSAPEPTLVGLRKNLAWTCVQRTSVCCISTVVFISGSKIYKTPVQITGNHPDALDSHICVGCSDALDSHICVGCSDALNSHICVGCSHLMTMLGENSCQGLGCFSCIWVAFVAVSDTKKTSFEKRMLSVSLMDFCTLGLVVENSQIHV